jgi:hypothetical protein
MDSIGLEEWKEKVRIRIGELTSRYMTEGEGEMKRDVCVKDLCTPSAVECDCAKCVTTDFQI